MALLDFDPTALPFNGAYPSVLFGEADAAEAAREAAALRLARGVRRPQTAQPPSAFDTGVAPLSFAGGGALGLDPSVFAAPPAAAAAPATASDPAPIAGPVPLPRPRPVEAASATDVSAASRSAPSAPLSLVPATAPEAPSILDRISNGINANPMTLLTLGAGIAQGGIGKGLQAAAAGVQADRANQKTLTSQNATYAALRARGVSDADAMLAMQNPEVLKALLPRLWPTYKSVNAGDTVLAFDESSGAFKPGYVGSKLEKVGAGETLIRTPGGAPGATGGATTIATGGPEKPPSGYEWVDPNDTSKGQRAIENGPADKIPAEVAARLGLAKSFLGQLPEIRKRVAAGELNGPIDGVMGAMNMGGPGELRRQIASGSEALLRNLTGAGMSLPEATKYVKRYEPEWNDTIETTLSKLTQLERELRSVDQVVSQGRSGGVLSKSPSASDPLGMR